MTPGEQSVEQVDALLASYKAAKDEIGRRSTLSWTAAGANLAFVLAAFKAVLDNNDWRTWAWAICTWPIACLTYQIDGFKRACHAAKIPEVRGKKSLKEVFARALEAVGRRFAPKVSYKSGDQELEFELVVLDESSKDDKPGARNELPRLVVLMQSYNSFA